jgi:hypothetical protein
MENKNSTLMAIAITSIVLSLLSLFWVFVVSVGAASEIKDLKRQVQGINTLISPSVQTNAPPANYEMNIGELQVTTKDGTQFSLKDFKVIADKETIDDFLNDMANP